MKKSCLIAAAALFLVAGFANAGLVDQRTSVQPEADRTISPVAPAVPSVVPNAPQNATSAVRKVDKGITRWEVRMDDIRLVNTLNRWAKDAGWRVQWDAERHFMLSQPDTYTGTFEDALVKVLSTPGISRSDYPLEACIYGNEPPLVRITRRGEQAKDCAP